MNTKGFSLVELSISIIIIGLLVAGITSGTKLIQQAETRALIADLEEYKRDYFVFQDIYGAVPGDFGSASAVFTGCASGGVGNVNCNGNGDGYVSSWMANAFDGDQLGDEPVKVHRHFNLSEVNLKGGNTVLPNNYSPALVGNTALGYFAPSSTADGSMVITTVDAGGTGGSPLGAGEIWFDGTTAQVSNFDVLTTIVAIVKANTDGGAGVVTPLQAFGIDRKIDDGGYSGSNAIGASTGLFRAVTDISGGSACVSGANYTIATTTKTCVPQLLIDN